MLSSRNAEFVRTDKIQVQIFLTDALSYVQNVQFEQNERGCCTLDWNPIKPFESYEIPSFPIHTLPQSLRDYVENISDNLAIPIEMGVLAELAIISVCLQGKVFIQVKPDYKETTNLYVLIIAEPGERKSPLLKILSAPLYEYEKNVNVERKKKILEDEMKIKHLQKKQEEFENEDDYERVIKIQLKIDELSKNKTQLMRLTSDDFTIEALTTLMAQNSGKMSVISSEGGMFNNITGRYSNKSSFETLLKAYTGDTIRVDRKSREPEFIENALLTILLMAQESVLEGIMSNGDLRGQGFLGRFLYCKPISFMGKRSYDTPPLNHMILTNFNARLVNLLNIEGVNNLTLSYEANKICKGFFDWIEPQLINEFNDIRDWASKLHGTTIRIAGILHCIENNGVGNSIISKTIMENACEIAVYFIEHAKMAFSIMGASESVIKAKYVLRKLESVNVTEISKREIYLLCRSRYFKKTEDISETLNLLEEHGYIRVKDSISSNTVGRKSTIYELNSVHFVHFVQ